MNDDTTTTKTSPRPVQRLDGPEALLTAEWNIDDLPWIDADDVGAPASGAQPPPPPSRRTPKTAFAGGAAAPLGAAGTHVPLITQPKPRHTEIRLAPVVLAANPDATLPPRDQRHTGKPARAPRASRRAEAVGLERGRPSFLALGAAMGCVLGYALWAVVLRPNLADAAPQPGPPLPAFLHESSASTGADPGAEPPPAPPRSTLPPELAATLAKALPPATGSPGSLNADAGAPAAAASGATPLPTTAPNSVQVPGPAPADDARGRAEALLETLQAQQRPASETRPPLAAERPAPTATAAPRTPHESGPAPRSHRVLRSAPSAQRYAIASSAKSPPADERPRVESRAAPPGTSATVRPLTTYTYEEKALFAIDTAPMRVTDLVLERGETLVSQPTAGDAARWVISVVPAEGQTHVFVKPLRPGLRTNLTLTTTRRTYFLELSSHEDGTYMAGVEWQYPGDDAARRQEVLAAAERERQSATAVADLQALRFDYRIQVTAGDPSWKPMMVFDDGRKTFIRFPRRITASTSPILLLPRTGTTKDAKYVNYRVKNDLYVVDHLFDSAELRLANGESEAEIVRITRKH